MKICLHDAVRVGGVGAEQQQAGVDLSPGCTIAQHFLQERSAGAAFGAGPQGTGQPLDAGDLMTPNGLLNLAASDATADTYNFFRVRYSQFQLCPGFSPGQVSNTRFSASVKRPCALVGYWPAVGSDNKFTRTDDDFNRAEVLI